MIGSSLALLLGEFAHGEELLGPPTPAQRNQLVLQRRREAAERCAKNAPLAPEANGDESRYAHRRASFAKTLPHNELGEVDQQAYRDWLAILASGDPSRFEQVPRDIEADRLTLQISPILKNKEIIRQRHRMFAKAKPSGHAPVTCSLQGSRARST